MTKTLAAITMLGGLGFLALSGAGCGPDTELGGTPVPNLRPDTDLTARPPDLLESSFIVSFNWTGFDPDGRLRGFQWKLSNNGHDGISVQDTLTFDPVTGEALNPWHFTAGTDTTLLVSADLDSFPRDPVGYNRSYQTHSFFVRAIDEDGAVDATPAFVSFNATTLLPSVNLVGPNAVKGQTEAAQLPPSVAFLYNGSDPDFGLGLPTKIRFLWKRALLPGNTRYAASRIAVVENMDFLVDFGDSTPPWSQWQPFARDEDERRVVFDNQPKVDEQDRRIYYVFAAQVQDTAGAVSIDRQYGVNVAHVWIAEQSPALGVFERYLGFQATTGLNGVVNVDIASGQDLNFVWGATADAYAGIIVSYRYGWDVLDPEDPADAGWALAPGNSPQHRRSPPVSFTSGVHTLTVEVRDNSDQRTRLVYRLSVVQAPAPADQFPLLWVDDVPDRTSNAWRGQPPQNLPYDNDIYRDAFYLRALASPGGVVGFNVGNDGTGRDVIDTEADSPDYRTIVQYKSILWSGRISGTSFVVRELAMQYFAGLGYVDKYNWLASYQQTIGNLLFCGSAAMRSFLPNPDGGWALPVVFQSREGSELAGLQDGVAVGFGRRTLPDGTVEDLGESRYPYVTWGISVFDMVSPNSADKLYGSSPLVAARDGRKTVCAGSKGLTLDPTFVERHMPAGAPFNSTIFTQPTIDWADRVQPQSTAVLPTYDNLAGGTYEWGNEEFYDQNITSRATFWNRQRTCANSPDGYCIEPMFRSVARFDWIMDQHARKPDNYVMGTTAPIPDNTTGGLVRNNTVPHHGVLDSLRVRVVLTHPDISQLRLELTNPAGVTITLKEAGTGSGANLNGWYPTDFTPAQPLSGLYGVNVNGVWRLRIIDTQAGGTGTFTSYTLEAWYNDTWPGTPGQYYSVQMRDLCGRYALTGDNRSALTDNVAVGMLSYKTAPEKPNQTGDILWGFDPYRYEHDQMVEAIRWVLGEHFGLPMRP